MASLNGIFDAVSYTSPKVSTFNGNHDIKTSCKIGEVFPLDVVPVYPRDSFKMKYNLQAKFSPLVAPAFQRMSLKQWSFYVRNSDLWDDFNEFVSGVNPKLGKTAYSQNYKEKVHPFLPINVSTRCGTSYIGVKWLLENVDLNNITISDDGKKVNIKGDELLKHIGSLRSDPYNVFQKCYEKGDSIRSLFNCYISTSFDSSGNSRLPDFARSTVNLGSYDAGQQPTNVTVEFYDSSASEKLDVKEATNLHSIRGFKPLFSPGSVCDYLGYPCTDFSTYFNSDSFESDYLKYSSNIPFIERWFRCGRLESDIESLIRSCWSDAISGSGACEMVRLDHVQFPSSCCSLPYFESSNTVVTFDLATWNVNGQVCANSFNTSLDHVLCRYLIWCKLTGNVSTSCSDAPYFDICPISNFVSEFTNENADFQKVDSLRLRGYHKIWNDYFRQPNLSQEIPVPFSSEGNDIRNYFFALKDFLSSSYDGNSILDWRQRDVLKFPYFKHFISSVSSDSYNWLWLENSDIIVSYVLWDLLTIPFKHLRNRDYITGCLPNTAVVDVVAPILSSDFPIIGQGSTSDVGQPPYTNYGVSKEHVNATLLDSTNIDPVPANRDNAPLTIGWLDVENLRITQKLKQYFTSLRHTMGSFKDYVKVFFDVDIDDATIHKASFLGGNQQFINVSELVSSSEYGDSPLGSLAGKANSYGESGFISEFVKDYGFIITLECLSPIESNVGGLSRQLIRDNRFDYFNPMFSELGDMSVLNREVSFMPLWVGTNSYEFQQKIFGYTQRYMDLKYIDSQVHSDFLGSMSHWHLDCIQPAIGNKTLKLSHDFLEESSDERIFNDTSDDYDNCLIWCECDCVFQRALPSIVREVIA